MSEQSKGADDPQKDTRRKCGACDALVNTGYSAPGGKPFRNTDHTFLCPRCHGHWVAAYGRLVIGEVGVAQGDEWAEVGRNELIGRLTEARERGDALAHEAKERGKQIRITEGQLGCERRRAQELESQIVALDNLRVQAQSTARDRGARLRNAEAARVTACHQLEKLKGMRGRVEAERDTAIARVGRAELERDLAHGRLERIAARADEAEAQGPVGRQDRPQPTPCVTVGPNGTGTGEAVTVQLDEREVRRARRDMFAVAALTGIWSRETESGYLDDGEACWQAADAMLATEVRTLEGWPRVVKP